MYLLCGFCVMIAMLGLMTAISPILCPDTTSTGSTILGGVMRLAGDAVLVLLGHRETS